MEQFINAQTRPWLWCCPLAAGCCLCHVCYEPRSYTRTGATKGRTHGGCEDECAGARFRVSSHDNMVRFNGYEIRVLTLFARFVRRKWLWLDWLAGCAGWMGCPEVPAQRSKQWPCSDKNEHPCATDDVGALCWLVEIWKSVRVSHTPAQVDFVILGIFYPMAQAQGAAYTH